MGPRYAALQAQALRLKRQCLHVPRVWIVRRIAVHVYHHSLLSSQFVQQSHALRTFRYRSLKVGNFTNYIYSLVESALEVVPVLSRTL